MTPHSETTELVSLELDLLQGEHRATTLRHLETCESCRARREEVRAGLVSIAEETRQRFDERDHIPAGLLEEYSVAPSGLGAEALAAIEAHLARCATCRDEAERARTATEATWPMPIVEPPAPAGPARTEPARSEPARTGPPPRRGGAFSSNPALLIGAVLAAMMLVILLLRFIGPPQPPALAAGVPVRLFGASGSGAPSATVEIPPKGSIALFLKLPLAADPSARYRVVLQGPPGIALTRDLAGTSFDRSATLGLLVDPSRFDQAEQIEVRVTRKGDGEDELVFVDSFRIVRSPR